MPDIVFADSETRSLLDVSVVAAYRYHSHPSTENLVWGYAFDDLPTQVWSPGWAYGNTAETRADPAEPTDLLDHIENGGYFVAWNAQFDRLHWNRVMVPKYGWPELRLEQVLCAQAQAEGNNLPGKLEKACEALGTPYRKDTQGGRLIEQLCVGDRANWDTATFDTSAKMGRFRAYCARDVEAMRDVWQYTRPLTLLEWEDYHVNERINDRGVAVDTAFAQAAQRYAQAEADDVNGELAALTGDERITVTNHPRKAAWLHDQLWPDGELQALTERPPKGDKVRRSADRPTRESILDLITVPEHAERFEPEHAERIVRFIELIEAGNSAAVNKFRAIAQQAMDGRLYGGYSLNGAGQTGRFSSRGVQRHNLIRSPVEKGNPDRAIDAIEDVLAGVEPDVLVDRYGYPVSRLLARLIRPTFIAGEGKVLVWADWDQIEGRGLPWLADSDPARAKLALFASGQDVYSITAAEITGKALEAITDDERQAYGKVPELALGFGGSVGALSAMARSYGVALAEDQKKPIVDRWRQRNPWALAFWDQLWEAALAALNHPGEWFEAGRVRYILLPFMRGTLVCELPCGRWLVYPQIRWDKVVKQDEDGHEYVRDELRFTRGIGGGYGRFSLWYGMLAENVTQGIAASVLRYSLRQFDMLRHWLPIVLHTHDEVVSEVDEKDVVDAESTMEAVMVESLPQWADGLPLSISLESGPFYTK